jgi:hypothetical protein
MAREVSICFSSANFSAEKQQSHVHHQNDLYHVSEDQGRRYQQLDFMSLSSASQNVKVELQKTRGSGSLDAIPEVSENGGYTGYYTETKLKLLHHRIVSTVFNTATRKVPDTNRYQRASKSGNVSCNQQNQRTIPYLSNFCVLLSASPISPDTATSSQTIILIIIIIIIGLPASFNRFKGKQ